MPLVGSVCSKYQFKVFGRVMNVSPVEYYDRLNKNTNPRVKV